MTPVKKYSVIGFNSDGSLFMEHVEARDAWHAFAKVGHQCIELEIVAAVEGWLDESKGEVTFPGKSVVGAETIQDQPDVFPLDTV